MNTLNDELRVYRSRNQDRKLRSFALFEMPFLEWFLDVWLSQFIPKFLKTLLAGARDSGSIPGRRIIP